MDLAHPEYGLLGADRARVLRRLSVLAEPASGRRLHQLSGVGSLRTTQRILRGLVDVQVVGNAHGYSLDREHVLWEPIERILAVRAVTQSRIAQILETELAGRAVSTALYGSYARGEATAGSDVDILIVWDVEPSQEEAAQVLDRIAEQIRRLTGNEAQLLPVTRADLQQLAARDDPFVGSLRRDARTLTGATITEVLRVRSR